ncbi:MAG: zinc-dependent alcohol dehydrogenase family protein [Limnochordaceae bacterium]|nr:zinc-dependent alcohol dehydrogenase family protein [Limnochordaceae bacterium]
MKAWVLERQGPVSGHPLQLRQRSIPQPGPGEVRLRVATCGVCHTDLHVVEGDLPPATLPVVPGHQIVGYVDALGPGSEARLPAGVVPGGRAGLPWLYQACGHCEYCLRGEENLCEAPRFTGYHVDGGYAEYVVAPAENLVVLPGRYPDIEAAPLLCAGIIGYRSLRVAGVRPGQRLALFGFGASAHLTLQVATAWGCEVLVFSRQEAHRRMALQLGAVWAGEAGQAPPFLADAAITFAPAGSLVPAALGVLRRGGTLAINAVHMDAIPSFAYDRLYWERRIVSVANATRRDAAEWMALAGRIPLQVHAEAVAFERANEALQRLSRAQVEGALVLEVGGR